MTGRWGYTHLLACIVAVANVVVVASGGMSSKLIVPGTEAPTFSLPTLSGERQTLGVWCGKELLKPYINNVPHIVILSFWATYCKPCQKEIPELMEFAQKHKDEPIKVFCISLDSEGASKVAPFVDEKKYTLPVLLDPYKRTAERYGVTTLPALIVIGTDGVVRYASVGYNENVSLADILDKALVSAKQGKNIVSQQSSGETVAVHQDMKQASTANQQIPAQDRWHAVARIECGESPKVVADELAVPVEQVKEWQAQLKQAAGQLWNTPNEKK